MNTHDNLNHEFLELLPVKAPKRVFLGEMSISARVRLFVLTGLFAITVSTGLFLFAENRLFVAFDKVMEADHLAVLAVQLQLSVSKARSAEKSFLISGDRTFAGEFQSHLVSAGEVLNRLAQIPVILSQQKYLDTIRDGLAQYDLQFSKILDLEQTQGLDVSRRLKKDLPNVTKEARQFDDLLSYLAPSTDAVVEFSEGLLSSRSKDLDFARVVSRVIIICVGACFFVLLTLVGFMVIRSFAIPLRELAFMADRLVQENNLDAFPAHRNSDATVAIARALNHWQEALSDLFLMRQKLATTLEEESIQTEASDYTSANLVRQELLSEEIKKLVPNESLLEPTATDFPTSLSDKPLSSASRQLASFSKYVNAAANDVERTGALIKGLDETTQQMEKMNTLVISIRDQTNLLEFCSDPQNSDSNNLVFISDEGKKTLDGSSLANKDLAQCVGAIREATKKVEGVAISMREAMAETTLMAREIAITASKQAIEATTKLLSQSEHLQNMLGDVISKVEPLNAVGGAAEEGTVRELKDVQPKNPTIKT